MLIMICLRRDVQIKLLDLMSGSSALVAHSSAAGLGEHCMRPYPYRVCARSPDFPPKCGKCALDYFPFTILETCFPIFKGLRQQVILTECCSFYFGILCCSL